MWLDIVHIVHKVQTGSCTNLDRHPLACIGLHKAAWGQVVLKYICILVCCYKQLNAYINTAFQGICINVDTLLETFLSIYFIIFLSLYFSIHLAVRI